MVICHKLGGPVGTLRGTGGGATSIPPTVHCGRAGALRGTGAGCRRLRELPPDEEGCAPPGSGACFFLGVSDHLMDWVVSDGAFRLGHPSADLLAEFGGRGPFSAAARLAIRCSSEAVPTMTVWQ